jgi:hypothetical protein
MLSNCDWAALKPNALLISKRLNVLTADDEGADPAAMS